MSCSVSVLYWWVGRTQQRKMPEMLRTQTWKILTQGKVLLTPSSEKVFEALKQEEVPEEPAQAFSEIAPLPGRARLPQVAPSQPISIVHGASVSLLKMLSAESRDVEICSITQSSLFHLLQGAFTVDQPIGMEFFRA